MGRLGKRDATGNRADNKTASGGAGNGTKMTALVIGLIVFIAFGVWFDRLGV
jgi:hypothetical protein